MTILIASDRDGTINKDEDYYLGKDSDWKKQMEFLPGVVEGIRLLNTIANTSFFIVTAQSGVAIANPDFAGLHEVRMKEVNDYIVGDLEKKGLRIDGWFACSYVDSKYVTSKKGKYDVHLQYVKDGHEDIKPNIGMLRKAAKHMGSTVEELEGVYMIGDRASDVMMGLNAGGKGILINSFKTQELGDLEKVQKLQEQYPDRVFIAPSFMSAAVWIQDDISANNRTV